MRFDRNSQTSHTGALGEGFPQHALHAPPSTATLEAELDGARWHALVLEIPTLLDAEPPEGLTLDRVTVGTSG